MRKIVEFRYAVNLLVTKHLHPRLILTVWLQASCPSVSALLQEMPDRCVS